MFGLDDSFGTVMVENLKVPLLHHWRVHKRFELTLLSQVRGVSLPWAEPYPTFDMNSLRQKPSLFEVRDPSAYLFSNKRQFVFE